MSGEAVIADTEEADNYPKEQKKIIKEGRFIQQQVFNVDEIDTMIYYNYK